MLVCFSVELGRRAVDKDNIRSLANFKIPATLFGWSFPISSIMQCNLKSLNFREAASLNTLISMILIIAFTRISVPSEPTLEIFSTNPVSLPFFYNAET